MRFYRIYIPSLILTVLLTIAALITLLPAFGMTSWVLYTPASTIGLLGLVWINCMVRADMKRKELGR